MVASAQDGAGRNRSRSAPAETPAMAPAVHRLAAGRHGPGIAAAGAGHDRLAGRAGLPELAPDRSAAGRQKIGGIPGAGARRNLRGGSPPSPPGTGPAPAPS